MEEDADGGWPYEFVEAVCKDLECTICLLPLREPYLTKCGHSMCKTCLEKVIETQTNPFCPEDRLPISKEEVFPDLKSARKILSLRVKCLYADLDTHGCLWTGELADLLKRHLDQCKLEKVKCTRLGCNTAIAREQLEAHLENECMLRMARCNYCSLDIIFKDKRDHEENKCLDLPISCPNLCGKEVTRKWLQGHLLNECQVPGARIDAEYVEKIAMAQVQKCINESMRSVPQQNLMLKTLQDEVRELKVQLNNAQMKTDLQEHQIKLLKEKVEEQQKVTDFTRSIFAGASKIADLVPDSPPLPDFLLFSQGLSTGWISRARFFNGMKMTWCISNFKELQQKQLENRQYTGIHTPGLTINEAVGLTMKVTLAPYGYGRSGGNHLSAYFELSRKTSSISDEDYTFETYLINLRNRDEDISIRLRKNVKQPEMSFAVYNIIPLDQIESNGFTVHDTLTLKILVRFC